MYYHKQGVRALQAFLNQGVVTQGAAALDVDVSAFTYWTKILKNNRTYTIAANTLTVTNNAVNYVTANVKTQAFAVSTTPPSDNLVPLATVTAVGGVITTITDTRSIFGMPQDTDSIFLTTKGSIVAGNGTTEVAFPVGADGLVLTADSGQPSGLSWGPSPAPGLHAATHIPGGGDAIKLADGVSAGLLDTLAGDPSLFLDSQHAWSTPPTVTNVAPGYAPTLSNSNQDALLGDGNYGLPDVPLFMAEGTADAGGGLITWTPEANDPAASYTINGISTEISFPSVGWYRVDVKILKVNAVATTLRLFFNGSVVDQASTTETGTDMLYCYGLVEVTNTGTDVLLIDVPTGGADFAAPVYNRLLIEKRK